MAAIAEMIHTVYTRDQPCKAAVIVGINEQTEPGYDNVEVWVFGPDGEGYGGSYDFSAEKYYPGTWHYPNDCNREGTSL